MRSTRRYAQRWHCGPAASAARDCEGSRDGDERCANPILPLFLFVAIAGVWQPSLPLVEASSTNPRASEFFERDPALMAWALQWFDDKDDGWLTWFEAHRAAAAFRDLADVDHDGRATTSEDRNAVALIVARY